VEINSRPTHVQKLLSHFGHLLLHAALKQCRKAPSFAFLLFSDAGLWCRDGKTTWEDLELDDIDLRLKWSGLFHRRKRTPGFFMMRLKVWEAPH